MSNMISKSTDFGTVPGPRNPSKTATGLQNSVEIFSNSFSDLSSLELFERNALHISNQLSSSWLGLAQGPVFRSRIFRGCALGPIYAFGRALVPGWDYNEHRSPAVFRDDLK